MPKINIGGYRAGGMVTGAMQREEQDRSNRYQAMQQQQQDFSQSQKLYQDYKQNLIEISEYYKKVKSIDPNSDAAKNIEVAMQQAGQQLSHLGRNLGINADPVVEMLSNPTTLTQDVQLDARTKAQGTQASIDAMSQIPGADRNVIMEVAGLRRPMQVQAPTRPVYKAQKINDNEFIFYNENDPNDRVVYSSQQAQEAGLNPDEIEVGQVSDISDTIFGSLYEGTGPANLVQRGVNSVFGNIFPKSQSAGDALNNFKRESIPALAGKGNYTAKELELIIKDMPDPDAFFTQPSVAFSKANQVLKNIERNIDIQDRIISNKSSSDTAVSNAEGRKSTLIEMRKFLGEPEDYFISQLTPQDIQVIQQSPNAKQILEERFGVKGVGEKILNRMGITNTQSGEPDFDSMSLEELNEWIKQNGG